MSRIPAEKRYNARGERACASCSRQAGRLVYWPTARFGRDHGSPDNLRASCRDCTNQQNRRNVWRRAQADPTLLRRYDQASNECHKRRRAARNADRQAFTADALALARRKGFTWTNIADLTGLDKELLCRYGKGLFGREVRSVTVERLSQLLLAIGDLPDRPVRKRGQTGPPHPALGLVRARLDRMAYLAELEAAA